MGKKKQDNKSNENKPEEKQKAVSEESKKVEQNEVKDNIEEWLEEELKDVKFDEDDKELNDQSADELMKKAAEQIDKLQAEVKEWKDNYLRLHAEWDTYRRRTAEQAQAQKATACESLVTDVLPVLDDFERSINFAKENGEKGLLDGVVAVHSKLISTLEKNGAEVIDPEEGEAFDALQHQAVATIENKQMFDESIASVMQKGFKMGNKVIRPAMVSVTTGGEKRPKEEDKEENEDNNVKSEE